MLKNNGRIETLQILRTIAFFEIFLGHCGITFFTGAFGVSIFIVLSGFCMGLNYLPKADKLSVSPVFNVKNALGKVKKLYGLHLLMLGAAYLLAKMPTSTEAMKRLVMDVLLLQSLSPYSADFFSYNGVAWYLSTYLFLCIFSLYVIKLISRCKSRKCVITAATIVYVVMAVIGFILTKKSVLIGDGFAFWFTYIFPGYRLLEFALGVLLGWLYLNTEKKECSKVVFSTALECAAVIAFIVVIKVFHKMEGFYDGICYTALFTPISLFLVAVFAMSRGWIMKLFNNPVFLWLGNLSTYTFLIHQVVIRWLRQVLDVHYSGNHYVLVLTILSFVITGIAAMLVQYLSKLKTKN